MKIRRQEALIQIITETNVETQEELQKLLREKGFNTTQATISRDIKELKIEKISYNGNRHKYAVRVASNNNENNESYKHILGNGITSIDYANNIIVVKTVSGMAMAAAAAIDNLDIKGIMGCIAGDDTIFLAIKDSNLAEEIIGEIKNVAKYAY